MFKKRTKLSELIKNAFKVEALESRILLSGDPVFGAMQVASTRLFEPSAPLDAFSEQYTLASFKQFNNVAQQTSGFERPEADSDFVVDDLAFNVANITTDLYVSGGEFIIGATDTLGGSGSVNLDVTNAGKLSPGYSPGVQNFDDLTNTDTSEITIELAGLAAGSQYDQINIANNLVFDGALSIELLNGFIPEVGDEFSIMTYGSSAGSFDSIAGLAISGTDLYLDVEKTETELKLVTKAIGSASTFLNEILGSEQQNTYGELLNIDYFTTNSSSYDFIGNLAFSGFEINGNISVSSNSNYSLLDPQGTLIDLSILSFNVTEANATFEIDDVFTLELADFDIGLSYLVTDDLNDDRSWFFAKGQTADLSVDFSQAIHDASADVLDLSINPIIVGDFSLDNSDNESRLQLSGSAPLTVAEQTLPSEIDWILDPSNLNGNQTLSALVDAGSEDIVIVSNQLTITEELASSGAILAVKPIDVDRDILIGDLTSDSSFVESELLHIENSELAQLQDGFSAIVIGDYNVSSNIYIGDETQTSQDVVFTDNL
ncbi:MAG: LEPR-XLL domain-containing protein, partial [Gammaproteobacteria bacterium]|nr:LEPR-XLL domain-containing protein [Gammaproteobacteria bacterium]